MSRELLVEYFQLYFNNHHFSHKVNRDVSYDDFLNYLTHKAELQNKYLSSPARIQWELTQRCNLNCKHCYIDAGGENNLEMLESHNTAELDRCEIQDLINEIKNNNVVIVEIQGGEPFLNNNLLFIVSKLQEYKIPFRILTNGTLLSKEKALRLKKIIKSDECRLQISLDGPNAEINDKVRSNGSFKNAIKGMENLRDVGLLFGINFTLNDINVNYLSETYRLVSELGGCNSFSFSTLMNVGRGCNLEFERQDLGIEQAIMTKKMEVPGKKPKVLGFVGYIQHLKGYKEAFYEVFGNKKVVFSYSHIGRSSMDINSNGDCYPGSYLQLPEFFAGNVRNKTISEIWHTKTWEDLRSLELGKTKDCVSCELNKICSKGSPAARYLKHSTFNAPDPHCRFKNNQLEK